MRNLNRQQYHYNNYQNRQLSPIRFSNRPLSPYSRSPFRNPGPLSPLRARRSERTPTKYEGEQRMFYRSPRNTHNYATEQIGHISHQKQKDHMQQTLKNGVGLFQNLAQQSKLNSDKKQNKLFGYGGSNSKNTTNTSNTPSKQSRNYQPINTKPFESSEQHHKNSGIGNKFSFTALLKNVKHIESIQDLDGPSINKISEQIQQNHLSFRTNEKSQNEVVSYRHTEISEIGSFGKGKGFSELMINSKSKEQSKIISEIEFGKKNKQSSLIRSKPQHRIQESVREEKLLQKIEEKNRVEQISQDYEDISFLLKKVEEKDQALDQPSLQEIVKMSISNAGSLNMKPFL